MGYTELEREVARIRERSSEPRQLPIPRNALEGIKSDTVTATCAQCGLSFAALCLSDGAKTLLKQRHCPACAKAMGDERAKSDSQRRRNDRNTAWENRLADLPKYLEGFDSQKAIQGSLRLWERDHTSSRKIPPTVAEITAKETAIRRNLETAIARATSWRPNPKGLGFAGESGHAKTRLMFTLLRRLFVEEGMGVSFITATAFGDEVSSRFSDNQLDAKRWIERLARVDVFFYDDMGKEALTERVTKELFNLIDKRASAQRPIFTTANFNRTQLEAHYEFKSAMTGKPIMNRLSDCCEFIEV